MMKNIIFAIFAILLLAGCTSINPGPGYEPEPQFNPNSNIELKSFSNYDDLADFLEPSVGNNYYGMLGGAVRMETNMVALMDSSESAKIAPAAYDGSFSETNNQVQGVDEGDIIKTDGEYIYTISGQTLFIVKAGEDAEVISIIDFENNPSGLFINGDKLVVYGNFDDYDWFREMDLSPRNGMTFFDVYDVSDKESPELVEDLKFEGRFFQTRMIGNYVYFVVNSGNNYGSNWPTPVMFRSEEKTSMPIGDIRYFNLPYENPTLVTVNSIDLRDYDVESESVAVEGNLEMYMSENNIFIAYAERINEWELQQNIIIDVMEDKLTEEDKNLIVKIRNVDKDVLSKYEKNSKILNLVQSYVYLMDEDEQQAIEEKIDLLLKEKLEEYDYLEYTILHRIEVDLGNIDVESSGKVPGVVNNQFSMDEFDGVLRIATTINSRWFNNERIDSSNHVLTLDKNLNILDHLKDVAVGERIYSTRFMSEKLYMVTFKQVDPFFVIDLSNPDSIELLGELKIPGFSRYLHPYDENTIIGIGRDASLSGRSQGLKISLFDVSDVENPEEIAQFVTDDKYAQSTAEYEHKAFLFNREKELLVIPAFYYNYRDQEDSYNGAMVFKITKDEIKLRGLIDHSEGANQWSSAVERSLFIDDLLYTKSIGMIRINELSDLSSVATIELIQNYNGDIIIY